MQKIMNIKYNKGDTSPTTSRLILPLSIPKDYIQAIDVTDLADTDVDELLEVQEQYLEYIRIFNSKMFNFVDWLDHTGHDLDIKYRKFKVDKTKIIS